MTDQNQKFENLDPAKGVIGNGSFIYVLRFMSENVIEQDDFCEKAQNILFDDIGSSGHFRIAPKSRKDLNNYFVLGMRYKGIRSNEPVPFMPRDDHELFVAFILCEDMAETPLSEEMSILPQELSSFCSQTDFKYEQVDVRELYRDK